MKILISILINSSILFIIAYLLGENQVIGIGPGIELGCKECSYLSIEAIKTYLLGGIVLGLINLIIRPILKILSIPLFIIFFPLAVFLVNTVILFLLEYILSDLLIIKGIGYNINGVVEFIIAVIIFSILNLIYSLLLIKK